MTDVNFRLDGKVVLITGASSGFGHHFASALVRQGAKVVITARRLAPLLALKQQIESEGGECLAVAMDVTDRNSVKSAFDEAEAAFSFVDVIINNAGVASGTSMLDLSEEEWNTVLNTNLTGAFNVAQEGARRLSKQGKPGSIINISSLLGLRVASHVTPYCASKAGLIHTSKAMALELARFNIRVNVICPGYILTDISKDFMATDAGKTMIKRVPQRRLGEISELLGPLFLLASDASSFMTGSVISVDGGHAVSSI